MVFAIREAVEGDNDALLELTRLTPMAGSNSLRIDREPDFFELPRVRRETMVFVATSEGKLIGCMSASIHIAYINGVPERIAHATDLKVHPLLTGRRVALRLISAIEITWGTERRSFFQPCGGRQSSRIRRHGKPPRMCSRCCAGRTMRQFQTST